MIRAPGLRSLSSNYNRPCYMSQFMPGTTTYLDTAIIPTAAFAAGFNPPDCAAPVGTPVIASVDGTGSGPLVAPGGTLTINSKGMTTVPNPDYEGPLATAPQNQPTIMRDFGFGTGGSVTLSGIPLTSVTWTDTQITGTVPGSLAPGEYQLVVTRSSGETTVNAVTVTVGSRQTPTGLRRRLDPDRDRHGGPGDLILVGPGTYEEMVVMWKPVRLQGSGADTIIYALNNPANKLQDWIAKVTGSVRRRHHRGRRPVARPGQSRPDDGAGGWHHGAGQERRLLEHDQQAPHRRLHHHRCRRRRWHLRQRLRRSTWRSPTTTSPGTRATCMAAFASASRSCRSTGNGPFDFDTNVNIHNNAITLNGALHFESAGGGISLSTGSDNYTVSRNFICGNYTAGDGAGVGHLGLSDNGRIEYNQILFNQSVNNSFTQHGGGVLIAGEPGQPPALSLGAGHNLEVDGNLIQGNVAASGHGGGIRTQLVNGDEVEQSANPDNWHQADDQQQHDRE